MRSLRLLPIVAALVAALAATAPVLAGGVAVVIPGETGGAGVTAGDDTTVRFELLQHGISPVDFGVTTVVLTDIATGESFRVTASPVEGRAGHFEAAFAYPRAGWWTWHVEHQDLLIQSEPAVVGIFGKDGMMPGFYPEQVSSPTQLVAQELAKVRLENQALQAQVEQLTGATAASTDRAAATEGRLPLAVTALGILAAALAGIGIGFGTTRLATRVPRSSVREIAVAMPADAD